MLVHELNAKAWRSGSINMRNIWPDLSVQCVCVSVCGLEKPELCGFGVEEATVDTIRIDFFHHCLKRSVGVSSKQSHFNAGYKINNVTNKDVKCCISERQFLMKHTHTHTSYVSKK